MVHGIERFIIHFLSSTFLVLLSFFALYYWIKFKPRVGNWISGEWKHLITTCALLVFVVASLREPFDVFFDKHGILKSTTDQISWLLGAAVSLIGLRLFKRLK